MADYYSRETTQRPNEGLSYLTDWVAYADLLEKTLTEECERATKHYKGYERRIAALEQRQHGTESSSEIRSQLARWGSATKTSAHFHGESSTGNALLQCIDIAEGLLAERDQYKAEATRLERQQLQLVEAALNVSATMEPNYRVEELWAVINETRK